MNDLFLAQKLTVGSQKSLTPCAHCNFLCNFAYLSRSMRNMPWMWPAPLPYNHICMNRNKDTKKNKTLNDYLGILGIILYNLL